MGTRFNQLMIDAIVVDAYSQEILRANGQYQRLRLLELGAYRYRTKKAVVLTGIPPLTLLMAWEPLAVKWDGEPPVIGTHLVITGRIELIRLIKDPKDRIGAQHIQDKTTEDIVRRVDAWLTYHHSDHWPATQKQIKQQLTRYAKHQLTLSAFLVSTQKTIAAYPNKLQRDYANLVNQLQKRQHHANQQLDRIIPQAVLVHHLSRFAAASYYPHDVKEDWLLQRSDPQRYQEPAYQRQRFQYILDHKAFRAVHHLPLMTPETAAKLPWKQSMQHRFSQ